MGIEMTLDGRENFGHSTYPKMQLVEYRDDNQSQLTWQRYTDRLDQALSNIRERFVIIPFGLRENSTPQNCIDRLDQILSEMRELSSITITKVDQQQLALQSIANQLDRVLIATELSSISVTNDKQQQRVLQECFELLKEISLQIQSALKANQAVASPIEPEQSSGLGVNGKPNRRGRLPKSESELLKTHLLAHLRVHPTLADDPAKLAQLVGVSESTARRWIDEEREKFDAARMKE